MFSAVANVMMGKYTAAVIGLGIKGNAHGIRRGWFMWPANFDPVWLDSCNGFTPKATLEQKSESAQ
jgi:hypothetical protein